MAGGIPTLASSSSSSLIVGSNPVVVPQKSAVSVILSGVESISVWSIAVICTTFWLVFVISNQATNIGRFVLESSASRIIVVVVPVPTVGKVHVSGVPVPAHPVSGSVSLGAILVLVAVVVTVSICVIVDDVIVIPGGTISVRVTFVPSIYGEVFSSVIW